MATESTIAEQIAENAVADKTISTDGLTSTQHSIADQILAAKYAKQEAASASRCSPIKLCKVTSRGLT